MAMRKHLLLFILMLTLTAGAANEIKLCGVTISDELAAEGNLVPMLDALDNVTATGTVTYNSATQTLVLDHAELTYTPSAEDNILTFATWATDFTIVLKGANKLTNAYPDYANAILIPTGSNIHATITGEGSLEVTSLNWYAVALQSGTLTIDHTTVKFNGSVAYNSGPGGGLYIKGSHVTATSIFYLTAIELTDCSIVQPAGAKINSNYWESQQVTFYDIDKDGAGDDTYIVIVPTSSAVGAKLTDRAKSNRGAWYSLDGRRTEQPTKGLYVKDGRKVAINHWP